jgi:hypothetical protein
MHLLLGLLLLLHCSWLRASAKHCQVNCLVEQHTGLDLACSALLDDVLPAAYHAHTGIIKQQPGVQLRVVHKGHVVLPVIGHSARQLVGGV